MGGMEERRTPGNTLIVQPDKPYQVSAVFEAGQNASHPFGPPHLTLGRNMLCREQRNCQRTFITSHFHIPGLQRGPLLDSALMQGLSQYGNGFLAKFEAAACPNQLLEEVTLVDTPGVLSGEKQRIEVT